MRSVSILLAFATVCALQPSPLEADSRVTVRNRRSTAHSFSLNELADNSAKVDALFAPWTKPGTPGAAVLVLQDGEVLHKKGYGSANIDKNIAITPDTCFRLCSVTKQFTAMAIMILAERGALRYSDPLSKFFPRFHGIARTITIDQLLHHTGGLPEYDGLFEDEGAIDTDWPRSVTEPPSPIEPTSRDTLDLLARQKKLQFKPGDDCVYSNSAYVALGQIIEKVSGKRYRDFLADEIFDKLGMRHTFVYDETRPYIPNRAISYASFNSEYEEIDYTPLNLVYGEDGIYSTINDMAQWDRTLLFSGKLVKPSTQQRAFTRGKLNSGISIEFGYGWIVDSAAVWHDGEWLGFNTNILRFLAENFTVVVLANCHELNATAMCDDIADIYSGHH